LQTLAAWVQATGPAQGNAALFTGIADHLKAAREAATQAPLSPARLVRRPRGGGLIERALSNLDAAETQLINAADRQYLLGMMPSILSNVECHLIATDARRVRLEQIAENIGIKNPSQAKAELTLDKRLAMVEESRGEIAAAMRAAQSAALREQVRIRDFRNVVAWTTLAMTVVALTVAMAGFFGREKIPMCFAPEQAGRAIVVCPTGQSSAFPADRFATAPSPSAAPSTIPSAAGAATPSTTPSGSAPSSGVMPDVDAFVAEQTTRWDLGLVEMMGLVAAAVAAALAIRKLQGSSERRNVLVWLAALKLPTGAVTAFAGLMLMRGQFVPGLSALDTPAQILAWAVIFGYSQQLFTRLVDQQGQKVLNSVKGADATQPKPTPP